MTKKNGHAQALGSLGGKARHKALSKARRREIASLGGLAAAQKKKDQKALAS